jgi:lysophospholipase L1-like esterase
MQQFRRTFLTLVVPAIVCSGLGMALTPSLPAADSSKFSRWEKSIAKFEAADEKKLPPENGILFVGSSSIVRWDVQKSFPDLPVINRGFGGSQLADSVHFAPRIVLKYKPRIVVLYAGDNDLAAGKSPETVVADFQAFVKTVHKALPETRILYLSIKASTRRWKIVDKIRDTNTRIAAECEKLPEVTYLDVFQPMLGSDGMPRQDLLAKDGLHLSDAGYALWNRLLRPYLKPAPEAK